MTATAARKPGGAEAVDDAALLSAVARDDLGALGVLYDRHVRAVWRVVHRVTNGAGDVDDIVHTTFLAVPKLAASFDGRPSARNWLIGVAVRTALRHIRGVGRFARMLTRYSHVAHRSEELDPEARTLGRARLEALDSALSKLPVAKRAVFVLVELEGFTHAEVADELGIPMATVRTRLFHAKRALLADLQAAGQA